MSWLGFVVLLVLKRVDKRVELLVTLLPPILHICNLAVQVVVIDSLVVPLWLLAHVDALPACHLTGACTRSILQLGVSLNLLGEVSWCQSPILNLLPAVVNLLVDVCGVFLDDTLVEVECCATVVVAVTDNPSAEVSPGLVRVLLVAVPVTTQ